ncbi:MAG: hypothetical protein P4M11_13025 [Candidatus Pacebacteria bacterium]|nr:hypothetical protein [Candidatus Paceibacterota bacterium]
MIPTYPFFGPKYNHMRLVCGIVHVRKNVDDEVLDLDVRLAMHGVTKFGESVHGGEPVVVDPLVPLEVHVDVLEPRKLLEYLHARLRATCRTGRISASDSGPWTFSSIFDVENSSL